MKNYYDVLGIAKSSRLKEIRAAYRKLALRFHPDVNPSSSSNKKFLEINEAYSVLRDAVRRAHYDKLLVSNVSNKRQEKWSRDVKRSADKGRNRGQRYAEKPIDEMDSKTSAWHWDILGVILEFLFSLF